MHVLVATAQTRRLTYPEWGHFPTRIHSANAVLSCQNLHWESLGVHRQIELNPVCVFLQTILTCKLTQIPVHQSGVYAW